MIAVALVALVAARPLIVLYFAAYCAAPFVAGYYAVAALAAILK